MTRDIQYIERYLLCISYKLDCGLIWVNKVKHILTPDWGNQSQTTQETYCKRGRKTWCLGNIGNHVYACVLLAASCLRLCTWVHIHPHLPALKQSSSACSVLKQQHDRRGSGWIRCDSAPETMAGKQALHKSLHSHLQFFATGRGTCSFSIPARGMLLIFRY